MYFFFSCSPNHRHAHIQPDLTKRQGQTGIPRGAAAILSSNLGKCKSLLEVGREIFMDSWDAQQEQCLQALLESFNFRGFKHVVDLGGRELN